MSWTGLQNFAIKQTKQWLLWVAIVFGVQLFTAAQALATHTMGGDISYRWISGNTYEITLSFYRDCAATVSQAATAQVSIRSASCGFQGTVNLPRTGPIEVSSLCPAQLANSNCKPGGIYPGVLQYIYRGTVTLPAKCADWRFGYSSIARNSSDNLVIDPNTTPFYIEATLDNLNFNNNNSPTFANLPVPYICAGQPFNYNHGVIDADSDSIVYSSIQPLSASGTPIPYQTGFTLANPLYSSSGFTTNTSNGQIFFTPSQNQKAVLTILVREYRNGVLIGSTMRDIQVTVITCNNQPPGPPTIENLVNGTDVSSGGLDRSIELCLGLPLSFDLVISDPDSLDNLTLISNIIQALPGTATISTSGSNPIRATINWTPPQAAIGFNSFTVTVTDDACPFTSSQSFAVQIYINGPNIALTPTNISCHGLTDGQIVANITQGQQPYYVVFQPGNIVSTGTTATYNNLPAGVYSITVTDADGCVNTQTATIVDPPLLTATLSGQTNILCNGASTGNIDLAVAGGTPPYTYLWSNGSTLEDPKNLPAGTYSVIVRDARNCSTTVNNVVLTQPQALVLSTIKVNTSCTNLANGSIDLTIQGGVAPYSIVWNNGATTEDLSNLGVGSYSATVTDANGCTRQTTVAITGGAVPLVFITPPVSSICLGNSAQLTANGAVSYAWSPPAGLNQVTGSVVFASPTETTTYTVVGTAANGCTASATATVTVNTGAEYDFVTNNNALFLGDSCFRITEDLTTRLGTVWYGSPISLNNPFDIILTLNFGNKDAAGADGMAFVLQTLGTTNQGVSGGGIGYGSMAPPNFAVEFDTWNNGTGDIACDHIAMATNGQQAAPFAGPVQASDVNCNIEDGLPHLARITWDPATQQIQVFFDGVLRLTSTFDLLNNVFGGSPSVYWGITGSTGGSSNLQTVCMPAVPPVVYLPPVATAATQVGCNRFTANWQPAPGAQRYFIDVATDPAFANIIATYNNFDAGFEISATITGLNIGATYYYRVRAQNACGFSQNSNVIEVTTIPFTASETHTNVSCRNDSNGTIDVATTGGTLPFTYLWNDGVTTEDRTGLSAGNYSLVITDFFGCQANVDVAITQPPLPVSVLLTPSPVLCNGGSTGSVSATPSGGVGGYIFQWSGGSAATTQNISGLPVGDFTLTVTDANGCTTSATVTITEPPVLTVTETHINVDCFANATGSIDITPAGGVFPYTYNWNNGFAASQDLNTIPAGDYTVVVTDSNACTVSITVSITQPTAPLNAISAATNVSCNGANNGSIDLTVTGGTAGYTFLWSPGGQTSEDVVGLAPGVYSVLVTDAQGCQFNAQNIVITEPAPLSATFTTTNVLCFGGNNGAIDVTTQGGTQPYAFQWSGGSAATTEDIANLAAGAYQLTITDALGCEFVLNAQIVQPPLLSISETHIPVDCFGAFTGSINITPTGGVAPYSFNWNNGFSISEDLNGVSAGDYTVIVTDANSCTSSLSISITQPAAPISFTSQIKTVSCNGSSDGFVDITVLGGTPGYTYLWSPGGQTTQDINNQTAGVYTVTITDANGCQLTNAFNISEPSSLDATFTQTNVSCAGGSDGAIDMTITGGSAPYAFQWSGGSAATTEDLSGLAAGTYFFAVTDAQGCAVLRTITITQPTPLDLSETHVNILCFGNSTGSIDLTVNGGVGPYSYNWNNGLAISQDLTARPVGDYNVVVTDANGCTATLSVTLTQPAAPLTLSAAQIPVLCNGGATGQIDLTPAGGVAPYTYLWNNGSTLQDPVNLIAGFYSVTVTDANGCIAQAANIEVTQPASLAISETHIDASCQGLANGSINITVTGGVSPYTYLWSNGSTNEDISGLLAGAYSVVATDANGCSIPLAVTVGQPDLLSLSTTQTNNVCFNGATGSINLTVSGGTAPYQYNWTKGGALVSINQDPTGLTAGTYQVSVADAQGCLAQTTVTITEPTLLTLSRTVQNVNCFGGNDGAINLTLSGATPPYTFQWSGGSSATTEDIAGLIIGNYTVTVTDANGCTASLSADVTQPPLLQVSTTKVDVNCFGESNGSINLTVTGGVQPYIYTWTGAGNFSVEDPAGLAAGTYNVLVRDANNCVANTSVTILQPPVLTASTTQTNVLCAGNTTGAVNLTVNGGVPPYTYNWNNGAFLTEDLTSLPAGIYAVRVTDAHGCTVETAATITQPQPLSLSFSTKGSCEGQTEGAINLTITGGVFPYQYVWSNGATTKDLLNIPGGDYSVNITDANGCAIHSGNISVTIFPLPQPVVSSIGSSVVCFGQTVTLKSDKTYASYFWSTGDNTPQITVSTAGNYSVTVTDQNGCVNTSANFAVVVNPLPNISVVSDKTILCEGTFAKLIASGAISYTWSPMLGLYDVANDTASANPLVTTTYTIVGTDANGCTNSTQITVQVAPLLNVDAGANQVNSPGNFVTIGGSPSAIGGQAPLSYLWSPPEGLDCPTCPNPVASPTSSVTYTLTVTDGLGCEQTDDVTVVFNSLPPIPLSANAQSVVSDKVCFGTKVLLIGDGIGGWAPYIYRWDPPLGMLGDPFQKDPLCSPPVTTTYTLTVIDASGAIATDDVQITVHPRMYVDAGADKQICLGTSTPIGGANIVYGGGGPNYIYNWQPALGLSATNIPNPVAQPAVTTQYILTVTDSVGCQMKDTVLVEVFNYPQVQAFAGVDGSYCQNSFNGFMLEGSATGGNGNYQYAWLPQAGLTNPTMANPMAKPNQTTTYTLTIIDGNGCLSTDSTIVFVYPELKLQVPPLPDKICANTPTQLYSLVSGGSGQYSYNWQPQTGLSDPFVANPVATLTASQLYTVEVTDAAGCKQVGSVMVWVRPQLFANAGPDLMLCGGQTGQIQASMSGGTGALHFEWKPAYGLSNPNSLTPTVSPANTLTYTLHVTDEVGCLVTDGVTVVGGAAIAIQMENQRLLCDNAANGLKLQPQVSGGLGVYTYQWAPAEGLDNPTAKNPTAKPAQTTTYTLTATDANGCSASQTCTVKLTAYALGEAKLNIDGAAAFCDGGSTTLRATPANAAGYLWYNNGTLLPNQNQNHLWVKTSGKYTVVILDANGCASAPSDSVVVTVYPLPPQPVISHVGNQINATGSGAFSWTLDGLPLNAETNATLTAQAVGVYQAALTNEFGCVSVSEPYFHLSLSVEEWPNSYGLQLYPNPGKNFVTLSLQTDKTETVSVNFYNALGQKVYEHAPTQISGKTELTLATDRLAAGVYTLEIAVGAQKLARKWVKN